MEGFEQSACSEPTSTAPQLTLSSGGASLYTNSAQQSAASLSAYNNLSSSTQSYADRFDAYRFPASSSSKRY
uniref:Uncharacterized protein n=1 Tax=Romanomermis culicivorax TaxID=13658 RepID=A0A915L8A1_ROMCU